MSEKRCNQEKIDETFDPKEDKVSTSDPEYSSANVIASVAETSDDTYEDGCYDDYNPYLLDFISQLSISNK